MVEGVNFVDPFNQNLLGSRLKVPSSSIFSIDVQSDHEAEVWIGMLIYLCIPVDDPAQYRKPFVTLRLDVRAADVGKPDLCSFVDVRLWILMPGEWSAIYGDPGEEPQIIDRRHF